MIGSATLILAISVVELLLLLIFLEAFSKIFLVSLSEKFYIGTPSCSAIIFSATLTPKRPWGKEQGRRRVRFKNSWNQFLKLSFNNLKIHVMKFMLNELAQGRKVQSKRKWGNRFISLGDHSSWLPTTCLLYCHQLSTTASCQQSVPQAASESARCPSSFSWFIFIFFVYLIMSKSCSNRVLRLLLEVR